MNDYLYHWLKKGEQKEDHKYIRREWKNGRWVYYYADKQGNRKDMRGLTKLADWAGADEKTKLSKSKAKYLRDTGMKTIQGADTKYALTLAARQSSRENEKRTNNYRTSDDLDMRVRKGKKNREAQLESKRLDSDIKRLSESKYDYGKSKADYDKTLMGVSERVINTGKNVVDKLFGRNR